MENLDFLNNIEDILYPEHQKEIEEKEKIKRRKRV